MKPSTQRLPSVVVIQERHVRHGENFKIFKVSCKRRREYIAKFMSSRKVTYRCKSRKVRIGGMLKETTYKGSPLAISRLLILHGHDAAFPTFEELRTMEYNRTKQTQKDNSKPTSSLSYFNLSDKTPDIGSSSHQVHPSLRGSNGSKPPFAYQKIELIIEKKSSSESLPDFNLIFGSDTNDSDDFDSDDDQEKMVVEVVFDGRPSSNQETAPSPDNATGNEDNSNIIVSLARMEKDIKQIVNAFGSSQNRIHSNISNEEHPLGVAPISSHPKHAVDPKPSLLVPPIPLPAPKRNRRGAPPRVGDILQSNIPSVHGGRQHTSAGRSIPTSHISFDGRNIVVGGHPLPFRNLSSTRTLCDIVEPSGSIPFFRVPGGCFMVIHATNQTTPLLHATFVTGCSTALQFQQLSLPVYAAHQIVAIHLGPYRLCQEEINAVYAFACGTKVHSSCNGR